VTVQPIDPETTEIVAGVVRPLRRAADLAWVATDSDSAKSSNQPARLRHRPGRRQGAQPPAECGSDRLASSPHNGRSVSCVGQTFFTAGR
jgi:hypothetical protein